MQSGAMIRMRPISTGQSELRQKVDNICARTQLCQFSVDIAQFMSWLCGLSLNFFLNFVHFDVLKCSFAEFVLQLSINFFTTLSTSTKKKLMQSCARHHFVTTSTQLFATHGETALSDCPEDNVNCTLTQLCELCPDNHHKNHYFNAFLLFFHVT